MALYASTTEEELTWMVSYAADSVLGDPLKHHILWNAQSEGSPLIFIRPVIGTSRAQKSSLAVYVVPTIHLSSIMNEGMTQLTNQKALELFKLFCSNSYTRTSAGWAYEQRMHVSLCHGKNPLQIFRNGDSKAITPSSKLLPGIISALKHVMAYPSFYWIPPQSNFPGINGVLSDSQNVFAVQATLANDHKSPWEGLKKVWQSFDRSVRTERVWHVVVFAETRESALQLVQKFSNDRKEWTLGRAKVAVEIWGCVFPQ